MGQQVELVLVGARKGVDIKIKGIEFKLGRATVFAPDEHMAGILRYMETQGAFPAHTAEQKQKEIDLFLASKGDRDALEKRKADLKAQLEALEAVEAPVVPQHPDPAPESEPEPDPAPESEPEVADGAVEDQKAPEGREDQSSESYQGSRKKRRHR
jgi:hypothetical protein